MGFFSSKKNINEQEFEKVLVRLGQRGIDRDARNEIRLLFRGDLYEKESNQKGIDREEFDQAINWLKTNIGQFRFLRERDIYIIREEFEKEL